MTDVNDLSVIKDLLINNGWNIITSICMIIFIVFHFPCSTTLITIYKETKSIKWTIFSFILPLLIGFFLCLFIIDLFCLYWYNWRCKVEVNYV
jgi:ferrous iron transport protein B